jgi:hypothetical protein
MSERIKVWQCIGCGRIDSPQNCIGVCEYGIVKKFRA